LTDPHPDTQRLGGSEGQRQAIGRHGPQAAPAAPGVPGTAEVVSEVPQPLVHVERKLPARSPVRDRDPRG
jgi:hypothetical protein